MEWGPPFLSWRGGLIIYDGGRERRYILRGRIGENKAPTQSQRSISLIVLIFLPSFVGSFFKLFFCHSSPRVSTTKAHRVKSFSWGTVSPGSSTADVLYKMTKVRTNEENSSLNLPPTIYSISQLHILLPLEGKSAELSYKLRKQYRFLGFWLYIPEIFLPKLKSL